MNISTEYVKTSVSGEIYDIISLCQIKGGFAIACGEDYDAFITALAKVRVMTEQMRLSLSDEQQQLYFARLNAEIEREYRETAHIG
ncbi:MAG: hypothetical protein IJ666_05880 [Ruminococcus sp.]|nr:hypothetical protein [Ruminococcus sp.]